MIMKLVIPPIVRPALLRLVIGTAATALTSFMATAHPYATCLTNSSGTVSFRLNEAADTVEILWSGGATNLGALPVGLTITNIGAASPFQVKVSKAGSGVPTQINDDANQVWHFYHSRGVAVNRRPASPYFGRIYVANSIRGTTSPTATGRLTPTGIYVIGPDGSDVFSQGINPTTSRTGGTTNEPATTSASTWFNLYVGDDDDMVYRSDWTDSHGNLWVTDPDIATNALATNVLALLTSSALVPVGVNNNHGSIACSLVTGKLSDGTLKVYTGDEDYQTDPTVGFGYELNSLWRYEIGATGLSYSNAPNVKLATPYINTLGGQVLGIARNSAKGYLYYIDSRENANQNILQVIDEATGLQIYDSLTESLNLGSTGNDFLLASRGIAIAPDNSFIATITRGAQVIVVPLVDGIPSLAGRTTFSTGTGTQAHRIAIDAAKNIYVVSSSYERCRIYSLGLTTTCTTTSDPTGSGGEGGSFSLTTPTTQVFTVVDTDTVFEAGPTTAIFTLQRTNYDSLTSPLTVSFNMTGPAVRGDGLCAADERRDFHRERRSHPGRL